MYYNHKISSFSPGSTILPLIINNILDSFINKVNLKITVSSFLGNNFRRIQEQLLSRLSHNTHTTKENLVYLT